MPEEDLGINMYNNQTSVRLFIWPSHPVPPKRRVVEKMLKTKNDPLAEITQQKSIIFLLYGVVPVQVNFPTISSITKSMLS
jgi:hypothetical protein